MGVRKEGGRELSPTTLLLACFFKVTIGQACTPFETDKDGAPPLVLLLLGQSGEERDGKGAGGSISQNVSRAQVSYSSISYRYDMI